MNQTVEQVFNRSTKKGAKMTKKISGVPTCECEEIHNELVEVARQEMPDTETLYDLADFFKIFGDSTRMSILFAIDKRPMCVCDIADLLGMTRSAVSHQIKTLRRASLVTYRKQGKNVIYRLADDHVRDIIETALLHIKE
jgi:ArsR family transcriptional regulator